jgi:hypothetical protein
MPGAKDRARTGHPDLGKVVLYQMSYFRIFKKELFYFNLFKRTRHPNLGPANTRDALPNEHISHW